MNKSHLINIGIIGYGRFGKLLVKLLSKEFHIDIYDPNEGYDDLDTVLKNTIIFIAVPIRSFEALITSIATHLQKNTTIFDTCSVKLYPVKIMESLLPSNIGIIATHPLFGPDSYTKDSSVRMTMYPVRDCHHVYSAWKRIFEKMNVQVIEMTPDEHDQLAARSQVITHAIGRVLDKVGAVSTPIDTLGFEKLLAVKEQTCHDTLELFNDMQRYNPYASKVIQQLIDALQAIKQPD